MIPLSPLFQSSKIQRKYNKAMQAQYVRTRKYIAPLMLLIAMILIAYLVVSFVSYLSLDRIVIQLTVWYVIVITIIIAILVSQPIFYRKASVSKRSHQKHYWLSITFFLVLLLSIVNFDSFSKTNSASTITIVAMMNYIAQLIFVQFQMLQISELIAESIGIYFFSSLICNKMNLAIQVYLMFLVAFAYVLDKRNKEGFIQSYYDDRLKEKEKQLLESKRFGVMQIKNDEIIYVNQTLSESLMKSSLFKRIAFNQEGINKENILEVLNRHFFGLIKEIFKQDKSNSLSNGNGICDHTYSECNIDLDDSLDKVTAIDFLTHLKESYLKHNKPSQFIFAKFSSTLTLLKYIKYKYSPHDNSFFFLFKFTQDQPLQQNKTPSHQVIRPETLFVSKIAHEFKNPLIAINELIDLIVETMQVSPLSSQQENYFNLIQSFTLYLFTLAKDIECYSEFQQKKKIQLTFGFVNIEETIKFIKQIAYGLISRHSNNNKINFEVIVDSALPEVIYTDETRLRQILINLISNSIKFTDSGSIVLHLSEEDEALKFSVTDTGRGIDSNLQKNIFVPFEKITKNNSIGSGLGLCIVRELSLALGKEIHFTSHLNHGSTFWFVIPLVNRQGKAISNESEYEMEQLFLQSNPPKGVNTNTSTPVYIERQLTSKLSNFSSDKTISVPLQLLCFNRSDSFQYQNQLDKDKSLSSPNSSINILIADDEELVRKSTIRTLKSYANKNNIAIDIIEASDGFEAIAYLCKSANKKIDLILCDENMKYCNGTECFSYLNQLVTESKIPRIPFVILSGNIEVRAQSNRNVKSYTKPINESIVHYLFKEITL